MPLSLSSAAGDLFKFCHGSPSAVARVRGNLSSCVMYVELADCTRWKQGDGIVSEPVDGQPIDRWGITAATVNRYEPFLLEERLMNGSRIPPRESS